MKEEVHRAVRGAALRRLAATAQHGHHRRQSAAADAVCYFRTPRTSNYGCNKRTPGSGCAALEGFNRIHAVLGSSDHCVATHPSDMCVAMAALEAVIHVEGPKGKRTIALDEFHKLPGDTPHIENALEPGELITHVDLPKPIDGAKSVYLKLRDRASYEFALGIGCRGGEGRRRAHPLCARGDGRRGH